MGTPCEGCLVAHGPHQKGAKTERMGVDRCMGVEVPWRVTFTSSAGIDLYVACRTGSMVTSCYSFSSEEGGVDKPQSQWIVRRPERQDLSPKAARNLFRI